MEIMVESQIEMRGISSIKPYVRNPRKNDKTVEMLESIIPKVGFNVPIVVDENGVIVKGHARYTAAIRLGMKEVPVIVSHASPEAIQADRLTDNKLSELAEWDLEELNHELDMLDINLDIDFSGLGFNIPTFDAIPDFEAFEDDSDDDSTRNVNNEESQAERQKRYQEYLAQQEQATSPVTPPVIATHEDIARAQERQQQVAKLPPRYYKVVCEHCGHTMFVSADNYSTATE